MKRRAQQEDIRSEPDLLVFGYSSHIFRDDQLALRVHNNELLVKWADEEENPIWLDRYDCRNILHERSEFEGPGSFSEYLPEDEEIERQCDLERYADVDSDEEVLFGLSDDERENFIAEKLWKRSSEKREEEFLKRRSGNEYGYDYSGGDSDKNAAQQSHEDCKESVRLKYPAPPNVPTPSTQKMVDIMERTANFIHTSANAQTEVLISTKQANNPEFGFLLREHPLHRYYQHIKMMLRTGLSAYADSDDSQSDGDENELLNESSNTKPTPTVRVEDITDSKPEVSFNMNLHCRCDGSGITTLPPDANAIIDKLADAVARNGPLLEERIKENCSGDPRFAFLLPWNEHHSYYKKRLTENQMKLPDQQNTSRSHDKHTLASSEELSGSKIDSLLENGLEVIACQQSDQEPSRELSSERLTKLERLKRTRAFFNSRKTELENQSRSQMTNQNRSPTPDFEDRDGLTFENLPEGPPLEGFGSNESQSRKRGLYSDSFDNSSPANAPSTGSKHHRPRARH
ncbi:alternative splicing regulator-domain-containing protein [Cladochytrium replicatum]|nr:alternative splicing regulator-domain-containing protein [Cladochytrium replicatum]